MSTLPKLPESLFWDVSPPSSKEDWDRYFFFVIERVLQRGTIKDWFMVRNYYGDAKLKHVFSHSRSLHPRIQAFGVALFQEEGRNQVCSPIPSGQRLWPY